MCLLILLTLLLVRCLKSVQSTYQIKQNDRDWPNPCPLTLTETVSVTADCTMVPAASLLSEDYRHLHEV